MIVELHHVLNALFEDNTPTNEEPLPVAVRGTLPQHYALYAPKCGGCISTVDGNIHLS